MCLKDNYNLKLEPSSHLKPIINKNLLEIYEILKNLDNKKNYGNIPLFVSSMIYFHSLEQIMICYKSPERKK